MAERVFASFEDAMQARRAIRALHGAQFRPEEVTTCSGEPILEAEFLPPERQQTRLPLFALAGGLLGLISGYLLPTVTATLMSLNAGGQPMTSPWAFAVVFFELTALGAIGGTFVALLIETGLPRMKGKLYADELGDDLAKGGVLVGVTSDRHDRIEGAEHILKQAGAKRVVAT